MLRNHPSNRMQVPHPPGVENTRKKQCPLNPKLGFTGNGKCQSYQDSYQSVYPLAGRFPNWVLVRILRGRPAGKGHFLTGIKVNAFNPLNMQVTEEGTIPAGKREPGHRRGHTAQPAASGADLTAAARLADWAPSVAA